MACEHPTQGLFTIAATIVGLFAASMTLAARAQTSQTSDDDRFDLSTVGSGFTLNTLRAESTTDERLLQLWDTIRREVVPEPEAAAASDVAFHASGESFFRLKPPYPSVSWNVDPPLLLALPSVRPKRSTVAVLPDIRLMPGDPVRLGAARDMCRLNTGARAGEGVAIWQPSFHCAPVEATSLRLNADVTYDLKAERLRTPLAVSVAQVFRLGPYAAELSGNVRASLDKSDPKPYDRSYRAVITLPFPD